MSDFCTSKRTKARKARRCPECGEAIQPGDTYVRIAGRSDEADFFTAIQCEPCHAFGERYLASLDLCDYLYADEKTYHFGDVLNEAAEYLGYSFGDKRGNPWAVHRAAMLRLFNACDAAELLRWARQKIPQRRPSPRYLPGIYSRALAFGMAACSEVSSPPDPAPLSFDRGA